MTPKTFPAVLLVLCASWMAPCAEANERRVNASIALKQEYSDNLYFTADSREEDFISTVSPGLELVNNSERLKTGLKLRWDSSYYLDTSDLNSVDQDYSGTLRYVVSERSNLFTSGGYRRDSRPDRDFTETGLLASANTRDQYRFQLGGDYALSEVMGVQLQYAYAEDAYESSADTDYHSNDVSLLITRDLSAFLANTVGRLNLGVTQYENEGSQVTNYSSTIGAERKLTELYSYFADIGLRYTDSTYDTFRLVPTGVPFLLQVVPYEEQSDGTGFTGRAGLSYQGELHDAKLFVSHDVQAASGRTGTVERTALQGNVGRRLTEKSRASFSAGYAINTSTEDTVTADTVDEDSLWLTPRITWVFNENISLEGSYSYALVHDNEADTDTERNLFMLRLAFQYPVFE